MTIKIKQHDPYDCGAVCLASICQFYKLKIPIARVRQYANTDKKGTNILGLVEAAKKLGFIAKGVRSPAESLPQMPLPCIAHVNIDGRFPHYVVIYGVRDKHIKAMDPSYGKLIKYKTSDFIKDWTGVLVLLQPGEEFQAGNQAIPNKIRFWHLAKPHSATIIQIIVGAFVYTLLGIGLSIYIQKITDYVIPNYNGNLLNLLSVIMLILLGIQLIIGLLRSVFTLKLGQILDVKLILGYYTHTLKLPQSFFDRMRTGEIISRINDAIKIRTFINDVAINILVNLCIVVLSFAMMFTYYWKLALIMILLIPVYVLFYLLSNRLNKKNVRTVMENSAELESQLVESVQSIETIKQFNLEEYSNNQIEAKFIKVLGSVYKVGFNNLAFFFTSDFVNKVFMVILFWVGVNYIFTGVLSAGELFSFYTLIGYFTGPISGLIAANRQIQEALIASDRLFEIMDLEQESISEDKKFHLTKELTGDIRFENITFRYGTRAQIFTNLSFEIQKGAITALVGTSGSGKSTLLNLLQNLYPLNAGDIYIGDYNIKYITNESLREIVSVVPQSVNLFAGTIIENISVGNPAPDIQRIIGICKQLGILEFIESLPNGFQTYINESGTNLSGGQKQRLAIARALYRESEIFLFDEATSSLDSLSDAFVQNTLRRLKEEKKTVLVVTHKLNSIISSDRILVFKDGKIIEQGSHKELLALNGYYRELWMQYEL